MHSTNDGCRSWKEACICLCNEGERSSWPSRNGKESKYIVQVLMLRWSNSAVAYVPSVQKSWL
jgi:hypothetical protein